MTADCQLFATRTIYCRLDNLLQAVYSNRFLHITVLTIDSWDQRKNIASDFSTEFLTTSHFYNSFLNLLFLVCSPSHQLSRQSLHNVCVEVTFLGTEFTKTAFVIKKSLIPSKTQYRVACIVSESTWQGLHTKDSSFRSSIEKRGFLISKSLFPSLLSIRSLTPDCQLSATRTIYCRLDNLLQAVYSNRSFHVTVFTIHSWENHRNIASPSLFFHTTFRKSNYHQIWEG